MTTESRTAALGGERTVPVPDAIGRDYLLLALRLGQRVDGLVDGYFGPADLKAQVDMEQLRAPALLAEDAARLRDRVEADVPEPDRRDWLVRQLVALETQARRLAGEPVEYERDLVRLFDRGAERRDDAFFDVAAAEIDAMLPGPGSVATRLAALDAATRIPDDRLPGVVDWLVEVYRARARATFGLPAGESFRVAFVRDRPWSGYNWYEGGLRSRFDLNLDLPVHAARLVGVVAHETYPGHHLEHAWKEAELVERRARLEASILLINTPECLMSEGLADLGRRFAAPPDEARDLILEVLGRAGVAGPDIGELAERAAAVMAPRTRLDAIAVNAALLRHADGRSHDEVLDYLVAVGRMAPDRAAQRLRFIEDPLWRSYVFVYSEGEALLRRWLELVPVEDRAGRFGRLLREQLTPSAIASETAAEAGSATGDGAPGAASSTSSRPISAPTTTR